MLPEDSDGYAIPGCDLLSDFLCEHQVDELELDPAEWPDWCDVDHWTLTTEEDLIVLRQVERTPWQDFLNTPAEPQS
jgi:hypothetical protein